MGLGSKSAFSYVNDFIVTSYHNGTKSAYLAYIDETNVGKISKISEEPTSESGLAIDVAVKTVDLSNFRRVASEFLKEFSPTPIVHNDDSVVRSLRDEDRQNYIINTTEYKVYSSWYGTNHVRMGNVNYPFTIDDLGLDVIPDALRMYRHQTKVKIYAEIGSVVPSASRETLEFDDQTKSYLLGKLYEIRAKMVSDLQDLYNGCKSKYELTLRWNQTSPQRDVFGNDFEWNGEKARTNLLTRSLPHSREISTRNKSLQFKKTANMAIREGQAFYLYAKDTVKLNSIKGRVAQYGAIPDCSYLLEFPTQADLEWFKTHPDYVGVKMVDLSKVNYIKPTITNVRNGMAKADVYEFKNNRNLVSESWVETKLDLQDSSGVYVSIKAFRAKPLFYAMEMDLTKFQDLIHHMTKAGIEVPQIYGIKERDISALGNNWVELSDYIQQAFYNLDEGNGIDIFCDALIYETESFRDFIKVFKNGLTTENHIEDAELKELTLHCEYRGNSLVTIAYNYFKKNGFDINVSKFDRYTALREQFLNRYPVFQVLFGIKDYKSPFNVVVKQAIDVLSDYILCK